MSGDCGPGGSGRVLASTGSTALAYPLSEDETPKSSAQKRSTTTNKSARTNERRRTMKRRRRARRKEPEAAGRRRPRALSTVLAIREHVSRSSERTRHVPGYGTGSPASAESG